MFMQSGAPLGKFLSKLLDLFVLQVLFLVTSIPVFTIGAGLTAVFSVCRRIQDEEQTSVTREYFSAFKSGFRKSTAAWLIVAVAAILLVNAIGYYNQLDSQTRLIPMGIACLLLAMDGGMFVYLFPLMAWFDNGLKQHFRNGATLALYHWKTTLLVVGLYAFVFLLVVPIVKPVALIGVSGSAFYANMLLRKVFARYDSGAATDPGEPGDNQSDTYSG